jgi:tetratricopeptide (TPR) repeat protein
LNRAFARRADDLKGRMADIEEALRLDPNNAIAARDRASLEAQMGRSEQALAHIEALTAKAADDTEVRIQRAFVYVRAGKTDQAIADMEWVRGRLDKANAGAWNSLCYDQAMWNLTLDKALADCDKAVALAPRSAAIQDSRAFVLLRLGRTDEAITVYDAALKLNPLQADSLFGRGVALLRKGKLKEGQADLALARRLSSLIDVTFATYGVTAPTTVAEAHAPGA